MTTYNARKVIGSSPVVDTISAFSQRIVDICINVSIAQFMVEHPLNNLRLFYFFFDQQHHEGTLEEIVIENEAEHPDVKSNDA